MESQEEALCVELARPAVDGGVQSECGQSEAHGNHRPHGFSPICGDWCATFHHPFEPAPLPTVRVLGNANGGNAPHPSPASTPAPQQRHVVFYSGGKASFLAAHRVIERYGAASVTLLFTDTLIEDDDLYRFLDESSAALGVPVLRLADGRTPWQVFSDRKFLGNNRVPLCSRILKQEVAQKWVDDNLDPETATLHFGIDWTEEQRMVSVQRIWKGWRCESPLLWEPLVEKDGANALLARLGIHQPRLYDLGASHNNCGGLCVRAGQGAFAWGLKAIPEVYAEWERHEEMLRDQLGDVAILRDRRGGETKPLTLAVLRARIEATPEQIDMFDIGGCGCFVDEIEESAR